MCLNRRARVRYGTLRYNTLLRFLFKITFTAKPYTQPLRGEVFHYGNQKICTEKEKERHRNRNCRLQNAAGAAGAAGALGAAAVCTGGAAYFFSFC